MKQTAAGLSTAGQNRISAGITMGRTHWLWAAKLAVKAMPATRREALGRRRRHGIRAVLPGTSAWLPARQYRSAHGLALRSPPVPTPCAPGPTAPGRPQGVAGNGWVSRASRTPTAAARCTPLVSVGAGTVGMQSAGCAVSPLCGVLRMLMRLSRPVLRAWTPPTDRAVRAAMGSSRRPLPGHVLRVVGGGEPRTRPGGQIGTQDTLASRRPGQVAAPCGTRVIHTVQRFFGSDEARSRGPGTLASLAQAGLPVVGPGSGRPRWRAGNEGGDVCRTAYRLIGRSEQSFPRCMVGDDTSPYQDGGSWRKARWARAASYG